MNEPLQIEVNGEVHRPQASTVRELLKELGVSGERIAVELNRAILPRARYDTTLSDGDRVEIVTFVGGG